MLQHIQPALCSKKGTFLSSFHILSYISPSVPQQLVVNGPAPSILASPKVCILLKTRAILFLNEKKTYSLFSNGMLFLQIISALKQQCFSCNILIIYGFISYQQYSLLSENSNVIDCVGAEMLQIFFQAFRRQGQFNFISNRISTIFLSFKINKFNSKKCQNNSSKMKM